MQEGEDWPSPIKYTLQSIKSLPYAMRFGARENKFIVRLSR